MLKLIIGGGQTGVDQAGWRAAKLAGFATGGWMPLGFITEEGPRPEFAALYGAREHVSATYPPRTQANVMDADATLWIGSGDSRGFGCTMNACRKAKRPTYRMLTVLDPDEPLAVVRWIERLGIERLNVAGNRESSRPGIGQWAERYLAEVFRVLSRTGD